MIIDEINNTLKTKRVLSPIQVIGGNFFPQRVLVHYAFNVRWENIRGKWHVEGDTWLTDRDTGDPVMYHLIGIANEDARLEDVEFYYSGIVPREFI